VYREIIPMNQELKEKIIEVLKTGDRTSTEIMRELLKQDINFNAVEFRETLAQMVREGIVEKYPVYETKRFYFRVKR